MKSVSLSPGQALYRAQDVRELDRRLIEEHQVPGYELMQRAAAAALTALQRLWPGPRPLLVCCGAGNNAGDGYVLARLARDAGHPVRLSSLVDPASLSGDARQAAQDWLSVSGEISRGPATPGHDEIIVDALLGSGLDRVVEGEFASQIALINDSARPVLALDLPSGLSADTGQVQGIAIRASATVSFIGRKRGLYTSQGPGFAGRRLFDDLGGSEKLAADAVPPSAELLACPPLHWPPRDPDSHKGAHGHVLLVAGAEGMPGAALLSGRGALFSGAGLVSLATAETHAAALAAAQPELMVQGLDPTAPAIRPGIHAPTVLAIGPGLGQGAFAESLMGQLHRQPWTSLPRLFDADALNWLARQEASELGSHSVLTPHPGEAARLLGTDAKEIQADRFAACEALVARYQCMVLLKGCGTLIGAPGETTRVVDAGNPGMAAGGMGDALTGIIAGLMAQGMAPFIAACTGAWLHGSAGDAVAAERHCQRGMTASDLLAALPPVMARLSAVREEHRA